jgi:hypothetical protein
LTSAWPPLGADFLGDARNFCSERSQRVHHRINGVLELEDLTPRIDRDLLRQVAVRDRGGDVRNVADLRCEIRGQHVDVVGQVFPCAGYPADFSLATQSALGADLLGDACNFCGEGVKLIDHLIDHVFDLKNLAFNIDRDLLRQVAVSDCRRDLGHVAQLDRQIRSQHVDVVGQILPGAIDAFDVRLTAQPALGADLLGDTRNFCGERPQRVHHRIIEVRII